MSRFPHPLRGRYGCLLLLLFVLAATAAVQALRPLPDGLSFTGPERSLSPDDVVFLADLTYSKGERRLSEQTIFDEMIRGIREARRYILMDMFLFNDFGGSSVEGARRLSAEVTDALVRKLGRTPGLRVDLITDPINTVYGGTTSPHVEKLRAAGARVVLTDLRRLRDSNLVYSPLWRALLQHFGNADDGGAFPHPFDRDRKGVTLRSWLEMLNFKANHRKLFAADGPEGWKAIVTSANPHDGSSRHSNVALLMRGDLWWDLYETEEAVAAISDNPLGARPPPPFTFPSSPGHVTAQVVTEGAIREAALDTVGGCREGDKLWIAMFYLSERSVVDAIAAAAERGVRVRLILDANRDAFGFEKNGIPNRPVAAELTKRSGGTVEVRWYRTEGEQFHTKLIYAEGSGRDAVLLLGSANLTRRNLGDYNLELDVLVSGEAGLAPFTDVRLYLERIWFNRFGEYTVPYETFAESSAWKTFVYRFQEMSGLCSF